MLCRWIIGLSASLACAVACFADQSLSQNWVGELKIGETKHFVQLRLDAGPKAVAGAISFPASGRSDIPLSDISVDAGHVKFAWAEEAGATSFDGILSAGLLEGTVRSIDKARNAATRTDCETDGGGGTAAAWLLRNGARPRFVDFEVSRGSSLFGLHNGTGWRSFSVVRGHIFCRSLVSSPRADRHTLPSLYRSSGKSYLIALAG